MPVTSARSGSNFPTAAERAELRVRVGAFVRQRRQQLGLRLIDMSRAMGYRSANAISNVESGIEGIPAKRAYAWADLLELSRDAFFQFVTGQTRRLDATSASAMPGEPGALTADERALLASYRRLTPASQARLREQAAKLEALTAAPKRQRR